MLAESPKVVTRFKRKKNAYCCINCRQKQRIMFQESIVNWLISEDKSGEFLKRFWDEWDTKMKRTYLKIIKNPICLLDIKKKAKNGEYLLHPDTLQTACEQVFKNAKNYNDRTDEIYKVACRLLDKKVNKLFNYD
jgi:hypothetical protein